MDDVTAEPAPSCAFTPDRRLTAVQAGLALLAVGAALLTGDPAGRLLFSAAALVLVGYTATDLVFSPRLSADAHGVAVRSPLARVRLPWADVEDVRADTRERVGLRSVTLELDAGATLIVLSRHALGTDPARAAALVRAADPNHRWPPG